MLSSEDIFHPSTGRALAAVALAAIGFVLPQEVPLEWYPLNHPGSDINYLEITCASNKPGTLRIYYDATRGFNDLESISWPVTATTQAFTYTFPLPDAPITTMRFDPIPNGATTTIRQLRIVNRRSELICSVSREMFRSLKQVADVSPAADGWALTSTIGSTSPSAQIKIPSPFVPVGMNERNLRRCLLSTGYLALMLWILLLALLFVFHRSKTWSKLTPQLGFTAGIALMFALVGNRGLIRNSVHFARFNPPVPAASALNTGFGWRTKPMTPTHGTHYSFEGSAQPFDSA